MIYTHTFTINKQKIFPSENIFIAKTTQKDILLPHFFVLFFRLSSSYLFNKIDCFFHDTIDCVFFVLPIYNTFEFLFFCKNVIDNVFLIFFLFLLSKTNKLAANILPQKQQKSQ